MARNRMSDLRSHLFLTIEQLMDPEDPMDIDRAMAVAEVGKVLVSSAKVEVEAMKIVGEAPQSEFLLNKPLLGEEGQKR